MIVVAPTGKSTRKPSPGVIHPTGLDEPELFKSKVTPEFAAEVVLMPVPVKSRTSGV